MALANSAKTLILLFLLGILSPSQARTQGGPGRLPKATLQKSKASSSSQRGVILENDVQVYQTADFDGQVIARVQRGQVFVISKRTQGPFYRIRLKPGLLGWIPDSEITPLGSIQPPKVTSPKLPKETLQRPKEEKPKDPPRPKPEPNPVAQSERRPFALERYRGPSIEAVNWTEDTMGATRTETVNFFGINWSGNNTMFSGEMFTDGNISLALSPPKYYEQVTGLGASGWILKMNFAFQTILPQSRSHYLYYGFGPSFTYSHFNVALTENSKTLNYSAEDMVLGALFDFGLAFRIGGTSPRLSVKYYWEKKPMMALSFAWGWDF